MPKFVEVTPAYGRDYRTAKEAKADWKEGKDFLLHDLSSRWDGLPCSIRDAEEQGWKVIIRYGQMRRITQA